MLKVAKRVELQKLYNLQELVAVIKLTKLASID